MVHPFTFVTVLFVLVTFSPVLGSPVPPIQTLQRRTDPQFPDQVPSCPICAKDYGSINSCAQAAPVLSNFSIVIFNPGAFIDVIKCACTDTFQAAYPQCVDCFLQTGQESLLNAKSQDLPGVVDGMRKICSLESALLGNVSNVDNETSTTSTTSPVPTTNLGIADRCSAKRTTLLLILSTFIGGLSLVI